MAASRSDEARLAHYRLAGPAAAPVIVLSSSIGTTLDIWDPVVARLSRTFRVLRYDHRGHGGSPAGIGPSTVPDLAGDVVALLDHLGVSAVHFCGLSLGGMVGMCLAARHPERVARLSLVCTTATPRRDRWVARERAVRHEGLAPLVDGIVARWFTPAFRAAAPTAVARVRTALLTTRPHAYADGCRAIATLEVLGELDRITAPTLIVAADQDASTPVADAELIAERIPSAAFHVIQGAAHLAVLEKPDEVALLIGRW